MYTLKDKVTEKLSRFFPPSTNSTSSPSPSQDRHPQARPYSKVGKSFSSYISYIIHSVGFDGSGSDKHEHDFKLIPSRPVRYNNRNSKRQDEPLDSYAANDRKETQTNQEKSEIIDDRVSGGSTSSSGVSEEAVNQHSPQKSLPHLMDDSVFISADLYEFLFSSLPNIVKGCQWVLLYSTLKHGISLRTLIRRSADFSGPCLLIVGDKQGAIFGGLLDCPLKPTPKRKFQGTNQSFVFTTIYGEPRLFRPTDDLLALGGGGNFALRLDGDL
ncbi:TLDc domain containing protein [Parasponia andersonii]|uniref:TLDc domain containing protein n=1 Tax=Parasponia andersonii TaxID=3476 RepID=A0A2P5ANN6_PARAD|nr:TLDc domain containing protein [Parasponia andersonii]